MSSVALTLVWDIRCAQLFARLTHANSFGAAILIINTSVRLRKVLRWTGQNVHTVNGVLRVTVSGGRLISRTVTMEAGAHGESLAHVLAPVEEAFAHAVGSAITQFRRTEVVIVLDQRLIIRCVTLKTVPVHMKTSELNSASRGATNITITSNTRGCHTNILMRPINVN